MEIDIGLLVVMGVIALLGFIVLFIFLFRKLLPRGASIPRAALANLKVVPPILSKLGAQTKIEIKTYEIPARLFLLVGLALGIAIVGMASMFFLAVPFIFLIIMCTLPFLFFLLGWFLTYFVLIPRSARILAQARFKKMDLILNEDAGYRMQLLRPTVNGDGLSTKSFQFYFPGQTPSKLDGITVWRTCTGYGGAIHAGVAMAASALLEKLKTDEFPGVFDPREVIRSPEVGAVILDGYENVPDPITGKSMGQIPITHKATAEEILRLNYMPVFDEKGKIADKKQISAKALLPPAALVDLQDMTRFMLRNNTAIVEKQHALAIDFAARRWDIGATVHTNWFKWLMIVFIGAILLYVLKQMFEPGSGASSAASGIADKLGGIGR